LENIFYNKKSLLKIVHSNSIQWLERIKLMDIKKTEKHRENILTNWYRFWRWTRHTNSLRRNTL